MAGFSDSSGFSDSYGQGTSDQYIPDYPQTPLLMAIAQDAFARSGQVYQWGMDQFNRNQGNIDSLMRDALSYASPQRIATDMGMAEAGVQQAAEKGRLSALRDLESYGIDPSSGRYAALDQANRVQAAASAAGAGNQQRMADEAAGNAMRNQAISSGLQNTQIGYEAAKAANALLGTASQLKYPPLATTSQHTQVSHSQNKSHSEQYDPAGGGSKGGGGDHGSQQQPKQQGPKGEKRPRPKQEKPKQDKTKQEKSLEKPPDKPAPKPKIIEVKRTKEEPKEEAKEEKPPEPTEEEKPPEPTEEEKPPEPTEEKPPEPTEEEKPAETPEDKTLPEPTPPADQPIDEALPAVTPEVTPEVTRPEVTPEVKPEVTPEVTRPEVTPEIPSEVPPGPTMTGEGIDPETGRPYQVAGDTVGRTTPEDLSQWRETPEEKAEREAAEEGRGTGEGAGQG